MDNKFVGRLYGDEHNTKRATAGSKQPVAVTKTELRMRVRISQLEKLKRYNDELLISI